jgi:hypothetical protein
MRRRPSPSLVLSIIAVIFSLAGTSVAAINFARNAGAVDGKSAVSWRVSTTHAAGKLVTTAGGGALRGRIPARFLDLSGVLHGAEGTFHQGLTVTDNTAGAPVTIGGFPGLGTVTATCSDQNAKAGVEDPQMTISYANTSGQLVNIDRAAGNAPAQLVALQTGTADNFVISNSNTFREHIELNGLNYVLEGVARQDAAGTGNASCVIYGYALAIPA